MLTNLSLWKQNIYLIDNFKLILLYYVRTALPCGKNVITRYLIGICEIILKWHNRIEMKQMMHDKYQTNKKKCIDKLN